MSSITDPKVNKNLSVIQNTMQKKELIKRKIAIIGCGPVGMFGTLLLQHFHIDFISVQKFPSSRAHPSAHWINASSKVLFRQIPGLLQQIDKHQQQHKWQNYQHFRYVETVFGYQLGVTDHFRPSVEKKLKECQFLFGARPSHIPQNRLLKLMYGFVRNKENIMFGQQITEIQASYSSETNRNKFTLINQHRQKIIECDYVILCNGASSKLRQQLPQSVPPISIQGHQNIINFIGIYFTSTKLAQKITEKKTNAMLHFVYNKKIIAILVNHSVEDSGEFMLQVMNFQPFVDLLQVYEPKDIISMIFDQVQCSFMSEIINDICIINVGKWQLSGTLASLLYSNGIFLVGDAAHSMPPAGGFGMNTGFHDIHELVHSFLLAEANPKADREKIFNRFSQHRWEVDLKYLKKALENVVISKQIAKKLGLTSSPVEIFKSNSMLSSMMSSIAERKPHYMEKIRLKALGLMYKRKQLDRPDLQLFFDDFDIYAQNPSILKAKILQSHSRFGQPPEKITKKSIQGSQQYQPQVAKEQPDPKFYNLYAREWSISLQEIQSYFGQIDPKNIKFYDCQHGDFKLGQRLIMSDGTVLLQ